MDTSELTVLDTEEQREVMRQIVAVLGSSRFWLRPYEALISANVTSNKVTLSVMIHKVTETKHTHELVGRGVRMIEFKRDEYNFWKWHYQHLTVWDEGFQPVSVRNTGRALSVAEYYEKRRWEGEVYRPGSDNFPMDSAYRVTVGPSPMTNYWNK